jgi:3-deoxy-D-manno-octulosonic-acid transferase
LKTADCLSAANAAVILKNRTKRLKIKGIYLLYRTLQAFGLPLLLLYFFWRSLRNPGYWSSLTERLGFLPNSFIQTGPGAIWLHAVSVGEILASIELLRGLRQEFPQTRIFVSTATLAGHAVAVEKLTSSTNGIFYAPADYVWAVRRVLRTLKPSLVIVLETEIWPNLLREVKRTGAGLAIINGRISDRAFPKYRRFSWFFRAVLPEVDCIQVQTEVIRERFLALGARRERVAVAGNLKYDFAAQPLRSDSEVLAYIEGLRPDKVWIAASTTAPASPTDPDEDDEAISAFHIIAATHPGLLLILAPRKPERFDSAANKLQAAGLPFVRRSELSASTSSSLPAVLLLDSIGELSGLFSVADAVFMGGTLASRGGHNILEPALFAKPVVVGPHMENFQAIAEDFRRAGACLEIRRAGELAAAVTGLLDVPEAAYELGCRAKACAEAQRGATSRALGRARELYCAHVPGYRPAMPWYALLSPLANLWTIAVRRNHTRGLVKRRQLDIPVISVGNITMGGTGKTPCVLSLAAAFAQRGRKPGILTRGYGRTSPEKQLTMSPGAARRAERTGDEPQLFLRSGLAPVGIGADRWRTGTALQREFGVDLLLLDDGFQHHRLARALDIVLLDALNPFGGGAVFPLGRLREPLSALSRADVILITRTELTDIAEAIEAHVRRWNPQAPMFRARLHTEAWVENHTGERFAPAPAPFRKAVAFCGLGNPESFRRTLQHLAVPVCDWLVFEDHHRYRPRELLHIRAQALAKGAGALVTTEKDAVNLCDGYEALIAPLPVFRLQTTLEIENAGEFVRELEKRLPRP